MWTMSVSEFHGHPSVLQAFHINDDGAKEKRSREGQSHKDSSFDEDDEDLYKSLHHIDQCCFNMD